MFPRRIGNKTKFFFLSFFFFSDRPFHGQFSQDDSIIIPQRRLPPPNPMGGLSKGKRKRKRKEKLKKIWWYTHGEWMTIRYTVKRNKPKVDLNNILEAHRTLMDFVSAFSFAWNINFKKQILQMFNETKYYGWYLVYWWQDCFNVLYKEFKLLIQSIKLLLKLLRHIQMNYTKSHGKTSWLQGCFHGGYTLSWRTTVGVNGEQIKGTFPPSWTALGGV